MGILLTDYTSNWRISGLGLSAKWLFTCIVDLAEKLDNGLKLQSKDGVNVNDSVLQARSGITRKDSIQNAIDELLSNGLLGKDGDFYYIEPNGEIVKEEYLQHDCNAQQLSHHNEQQKQNNCQTIVKQLSNKSETIANQMSSDCKNQASEAENSENNQDIGEKQEETQEWLEQSDSENVQRAYKYNSSSKNINIIKTKKEEERKNKKKKEEEFRLTAPSKHDLLSQQLAKVQPVFDKRNEVYRNMTGKVANTLPIDREGKLTKVALVVIDAIEKLEKHGLAEYSIESDYGALSTEKAIGLINSVVESCSKSYPYNVEPERYFTPESLFRKTKLGEKIQLAINHGWTPEEKKQESLIQGAEAFL